MSIVLLISSGDGPGECQQAVAHALRRLTDEAEAQGIAVDAVEAPGRHGPRSATVLLSGHQAEALASAWIGTILWQCESTLRRGHKRKNWFIGIHRLATASEASSANIRFDTFRAGGPGGQHQNTTESAVRATCTETGLSTVARDGRSQHRNKQLARERLLQLRAAVAEQDRAKAARHANLLHHSLERGNPVRQFAGREFREV